MSLKCKLIGFMYSPQELFVSTLEAVFRGQREMFEGLWIAESDHEWETYPVLRFDFGKESCETAEELKDAIRSYLEDNAKQYGVKLDDGPYQL
ncbi:MAG: AAA family ATPase [Chloroflexota bacterium]